MKTKQIFKSLLFLSILFIGADLFAQDFSDLENRINDTRSGVKTVAQAIIGLAAVGGGIVTYFKVQNDEGGSGKKAIGNFIIALLFASLIFVIIEVFV